MNTVHLEMLNIFLALNLFKNYRRHKKVLVKCDNKAVVTVPNSGRTRDPFLGACARNLGYVAAVAKIDLQVYPLNGGS